MNFIFLFLRDVYNIVPKMFRLGVSTHRLIKVAVPAFQNYEHHFHRAIVRKISNQAPSIDTKEKVENALTLRKELFTEIDDVVLNDVEGASSTSTDLVSSTANISLETFAPYIAPTFNIAAYVNKSTTLQELVKLGVDLYKWEKKKGVTEYILKLDFEKDMKPVIRFLHDNRVDADFLGNFLTKNPLIFKEEIENLQVRVNYLESKNFTSEMIGRVISGDPFWLMFSTQRIDRRLGHFQNTFHLSGEEIRRLATKLPRLITYSMNHIKGITFAVKEMMGFSESELKQILLLRPKVWMMKHESLIERFNYVHNEMGVPHEQLAKHPGIFSSRLHRIQQRHKFLDQFVPKPPDGKSRYDPKSIGYVSLDSLVAGNDAEFCCNIAKVSVESFNAFLKSL
ncbi:hypothetical protein J437_LFUL006578 [Ladona fulva]|uniref:Transcription termination factor 3, mitochondrial n=1 Tax=Ladona fulva TaxID=123851 RepID=A0A8K0K231_LADFU|nr:hypothetical protein J437_LFUL006578 [Ladona fulva]